MNFFHNLYLACDIVNCKVFCQMKVLLNFLQKLQRLNRVPGTHSLKVTYKSKYSEEILVLKFYFPNGIKLSISDLIVIIIKKHKFFNVGQFYLLLMQQWHISTKMVKEWKKWSKTSFIYNYAYKKDTVVKKCKKKYWK